MCISEWIVEESGFRSTYAVQQELLLAQGAGHLDFAESFSPAPQAVSMEDSLVPEAEMEIAA
jgi:hypothetical protein